MHIKTTKYHPVRMFTARKKQKNNAGGDAEKREHLYTVDGNVN
jgi:hypothetical protein